MKLVIINGNGGNDADVAVHRADCQDVAKATKGHDFFTEEHDSKRAAWLDYNSDFLQEDGTGGWPMYFLPCTKGLEDGGEYNL
jgi:hypothetical protein